MVPQNLKFTKEHEWAKVDGDVVTMGVSDFAQSELGDVVFVELPAVGDEVTQFESMGTVEAVKAVTDFYAPVSGEVIEVNETLEDTPEIVNQEPYEGGWFVKIKMSDSSELENLLSAKDYAELVE
ncbi:MAG: glycine cleavage system protein GcvH [bacterium]